MGAHKTGTTYINKLLLSNQTLLSDNGVLFRASNEVLENITMHLCKSLSVKDKSKIQKFVSHQDKEFEKIIFSHENISGNIPSFVRNEGIYPNIYKRIRSLNDILDGRSIDIVFFIRRYDGFILSCYSEYMRSMGYVPFEKFHNTVFHSEPSWVDVVDSIQVAYPNAKLRVFEQNQIRTDATRVVQHIMGLPDIMLKVPEALEGRRSISDTGVNVLALMTCYGQEVIDKSFVNALSRLLPKQGPFDSINQLTEAEINKYKDLYLSHRQQLISSGYLCHQ